MADTTTAGDIRSVIKNATQWWLSNKWWLGMRKWAGVVWQWDTIATKQEIDTKKADNSLSPKPTQTTQANVWQNMPTVSTQTQVNVKPQNIIQSWEHNVASPSQQEIGTFQNPIVQPIQNIKVEWLWGINLNLKKWDRNSTTKEVNKNPLIETEGEKTKRMSDWVYSLYVDAYNKWQQGGTLTMDDVLGNKTYQRQFYWVDQKLLQDMVNDANLIAQYDYDDQNALYLMDKYKNLWLSLDFEKLSHPNKWRVLDNMATQEDAGWIRGLVDTFTPFNLAEWFGWKVMWEKNKKAVEDNIQWYRNYLEDASIDILSDEEVDKYIANDVAKLDKAYEKYYHNVYEQIFDDKRIWQQFYKDVAALQKKNKWMTEEEAVNEVMKNWTYNWVAYEKYPHTNTDQWRFWDDKDKEKEYNKKVKELKNIIRDEHDNKNAFFGNATVHNAIIELAQVPFFAYDIAKNPWTFAKSLLWMAKGVGHKAIEWYTDLLDTAIATSKDIIEWNYNWINYQVWDVREKMAKWKWYESFDDMLLKLWQLAQEDDTPWIKFVYNTLKGMNEDREMAQVMIDYFDSMYGGALEWDWGKVLESIKEHPASFVSDLSGFGELTAWLLGKWGLISPEKVRWLQNLFGAIDPYEVAINKMNKLQYWPVLKAEVGLAKTGLKIARKPFRWGKNVLNTIVNKISGISADERKILKENPELVEWYINWTENRQTLVDKIKEKFNSMLDEKTRLGEIYEQFKNSTQKILTDGIFDAVNEKLAEKWIYKVNGKLQFPDIWFTEKQQAQILAAYNMLEKIQKGEASVSDAWGVRRMIDSTLDWEWNTKQGLDLEAINLIKDIRRSIDDALKEQVPWFREADANYAQIKSDIKEIQKDWFNKDGTIKDNAYSRVGNLTDKANKARLERLEKYLPWITNELKALAVAESLDKAWKAMVGQYANQIWGVWGGITALMWLFGGWVAVMPMILGMLWATMATPKNLAAVLKWQWKVEKPFKTIISKIENWIKLTAAEVSMLAKFLSENQEQLTQDAKYMYENWLISDEEFKAIQKQKEGLKNQFRKIEKDYKAGKISTKEYKEAKAAYRKALDDAEYDVALSKAEAKGWDLEREITGEEKRRTTWKYVEKAKNIGFVTKLEQDMTEESRKAWSIVRWLTNVKAKLIALANNPTDRTAQHEFFHAVMKVVDPQTRKFLLNEARKILGGKVGNWAAEEWLAESLGIYAKRWDINAGILDKVKWGEWYLVDKLRNFLQKNYEWMQNYNGDRETINKMFDEILKDDLKIGENWMIDLSYLLKDSGDNGWIKSKNWLKNKPTNWWWATIKYSGWVKMKKDTGAVKYKTDINWKSVQIDTKATSPDQLIEKNADWLSVMKAFISDKQAEKALNVSKDLLTKDGDAYLWTHTNKYEAPQFANFENTKDSKYKEFKDYEIAFFSNSEEMSKSYAKWKSKLADTKWYKNVEDFNKKNLTVEKSKSEQTTRGWAKIPAEYEFSKWVKIIEGKSWKARIQNVLEHKYTLDTNLDKLLDDMVIAKEWYMPDNDTKHILSRKERIERAKWEFAGSYSWWKWDVDIKELPNWKVEVVKSKNNLLPEEYDSAKAAMAEYTASKTEKQPYHYQWIIQDVKNPLVVDLWKKDYWLKDWKTWEKFDTGRWWNDLGTAYDLLERENKKWLKNLEKVNEKFNKTFWKLSDQRRKFILRTSDLRWQYSKRYDEFWQKIGWMMDDKNRAKVKELDSDMAQALNASLKINQYLNGEIKYVDWEILEWIKKHDDYNKVYNEVSDFVKENKDNLEYISYGDWRKKDIKDWLVKNWLDEDVVSLLHDIRLSWESDIIELLKGKDLQTNDYVFYALKNWNYDWVMFKDILDFGSNDAFDKATNKGWDVLVTFKSKNFKAWDNANPTDSKYISYKKDTKGLQEKDKLIWLHNLNINKLAKTVEIGGMPMPSIAVTKKWVPHTDYWDITLIMKESAINPKLDRKNKVHILDGYTPEVPQPIIMLKETAEADKIANRIMKETWLSYGDFEQWIENKDQWEYYHPEMKKYDKEYKQITEKKLWDGLDDYGRHYLDYNVDNIVKKMVENKEDAYNGQYGKMVAQYQWEVSDVDALRNRKYGEKDAEKWDKLFDDYYNEVSDLYQKVKNNDNFGGEYNFQEALAYEYNKDTNKWLQNLRDEYNYKDSIYMKIKKGDLDKLQKIVKEGAEIPRPYSEAKPERAIKWNEVGAVVAPEGQVKEVEKLMKDTGLKVYGYKEGERMAVVDKVADDNGLRFKKDANIDAEYDKAVKDGDNEKAMGLLRKRAAEMGYNSSSDYQGSKAFNGSAPSSEWLTKAERINPDTEMYSQTLGDYASDGVDLWDLDWQLTDRGNYLRWDEYVRESIDNLNKAVREYRNWNKDAKIRMYRAIDANIKEDWFRNGDWITPSKKYAEMHIWLQDWDKWRVISEEVPIEHIWWDNNDINEWWYDDGKDYGYKNTKNNRKELWITRDDKWGIIPLSKRFDENNPDIRYKKWLSAKDQTQTPEFKKWFKGSKVVNEDGTPKVVYHWSRYAWFTEFKPINTMTDDLWFFSDKRNISSYFGWGSELWSDKWLTAEFEAAKKQWVDAVQKFAKEYLDLPHEIELTVNHITPKEAKEFGVEPWYVHMLDDWQVAAAIRKDGKYIFKDKLPQEEIDKAIIDRIEKSVEYAEAWDRKNSRVYASYLDLKNPIIVDAKWVKFNQVVNPFNWKRWHIANIAYDAVDKWYDGAIIKNVSESPEYDLRWTVYIATKPNQIKSATDNIGTFDKNNPDIRYKKARHWSPADFDRFDSSHMGEWEGAQAHGWGHYVAVNKDTAEWYAKMRKNKILYKWEDRNWVLRAVANEAKEDVRWVGWTALDVMDYMYQNERPFGFAKKKLIEQYQKGIDAFKDTLKNHWDVVDHKYINDEIKQRERKLRDIEKLNETDFTKKISNLYDLEIPDPVKRDTPTGSNYLEEEGKITRPQLDKIVKALESYKQEKEVEKGADLPFSKEVTQWLATARQRYAMRQLKEWGLSWEETYKALSTVLWWDKQASKFLESLWYDGIHYYGGRDGEAYVLFNDDAIKINDHIRYKKDKITPRDLGLWKKSWNEMSNGYNMVTKWGKPYTKATVEGLWLPHFLQKDADGKPFMMFNGSPVYPAQWEYIAWGFRGGKGFKDIYTNEYIFDKNPAYQTYEDNFNQIVANANDTAFTNNTQLLIGKSELWKDIYFTKDALKHILKDHWVFNINNLLETVNNPDYTGVEKPRVWQNGGSAGDRSFFLKEIPWTDNFFLLGIEPSGNGYNVTSFYEITSDDALSHFRMQKASSNETKFKKNVGTNWMKNNQSAANISKWNRYWLVKKIGVRAEENK